MRNFCIAAPHACLPLKKTRPGAAGAWVADLFASELDEDLTAQAVEAALGEADKSKATANAARQVAYAAFSQPRPKAVVAGEGAVGGKGLGSWGNALQKARGGMESMMQKAKDGVEQVCGTPLSPSLSLSHTGDNGADVSQPRLPSS
jgi:hypothetical protein